jgi:hypothetical protein
MSADPIHHLRKRAYRRGLRVTKRGDTLALHDGETVLWHQNLDTTAIYVQVSDPKRIEAIDRLDPFGWRDTGGDGGGAVVRADPLSNYIRPG